MSKDWVKVYSTTQLHKAEIVKAVLEDYDIKVFQINKMDSMHTHLTNGEIELYVEPKEALKAKHIIEKNDL